MKYIRRCKIYEEMTENYKMVKSITKSWWYLLPSATANTEKTIREASNMLSVHEDVDGED